MIQEAGSAGTELFDQKITGQDRQDIMDLMLYANISASKKYNKNDQASKWMDYFQGRLVKYGCTLEAFVAPDMIVVSDLQGFRELSFKVVGAAGAQKFIAHAKASFAALQVNKKAIDFFRGYSGSERAITISISSCELTEKGEILILFCGVQFSSSIEVKKFFFHDEIFYDLIVRPNGGAFVFDRNKYATHRADVLKKLKEAASDIFKP